MKEKLIKIFNDTLDYATSNNLESKTIRYTDKDILPPKFIGQPIVGSINVKVVNTDSVSAIVEYSKLGKTCVLNMASYKRPGGGVARGAMAQEECLFRCSNLYNVVSSDFYPLSNSECLYTSGAHFFKDFKYNYMDDVTCDVVTIAALNLNDSEYSNQEYYKITKNKIRLMLSTAIINKVDYLVLGAWGCGVFKNDPAIMAGLFGDIILGEGYWTHFKSIVFAIINDHNSVGNNYSIFNSEFD